MLQAIPDAINLLLSFDPELYEIIRLSLFVSGSAVILAALLGIPLGTWLGLMPPRKVRWLSRIIYTLMGLPPVVGGLVVYLTLSRRGMLGTMGLLFTPTAMVLAQTLLAVPIILGLTSVAVRAKGREVTETAQTLGAGHRLIIWTLIRESRVGILGAVVAGFGRVIAEVGAVMMVGGNIEGDTRVLTTAIVLETRRGNFVFAMALGIILLALAFLVNVGFYRILTGGTYGE
ncbi:MAG: ABC transporter permease [Bacillota bacterium]|nr:ABC transporter permease [Bacillota bacterium]MDW7683125.1 ABC transporter permease [Bacillota bacterium]